jgi:hypothetical protein
MSTALPTHLKKLKMVKGYRNRLLSKPKVKRSSNIPIPAQRFIPIGSHGSFNFDDYFNCPTIEDAISYTKYLDNFPTNPYAIPVTRSSWEYFKDYGYRIERNFAVTFNQQQPILVLQHLFPIGQPENYPSEAVEDTIYGTRTTGRTGSPVQIQVEDVEVFGLQDMLDLYDSSQEVDRINSFVCGRTPIGEYIHLRPELDAVYLREDEVQITLDIDSIIWVTHQLHLLGSLHIHLLPYFKRKPPIEKNNHCHVEILLPPSSDDQPRTEWFTQPVSLSNLPHIPFAHLGDGTGSFNFYIFFPRMKHRNEATGYWATLIPAEVQNLWFTEVLIPGIKKTAVVGIQEYANFSPEEWKWKAMVNNHMLTTKTLTLDSQSIPILVQNLRNIIKQNPYRLDMFGSFFFVMDSRGIKLSTINIRGRHLDPFQNLKKEIPTLDWEYMILRENGQLLMDLGVSYHPDPEDGQPLIGFWKLSSLHASYTASGMNKPEVYRSCTMAGYGGMQAGMEATRSRAVQLTFRSTYNLLFELVRRPGQDEKFCADKEAYNMSPVFQDTWKGFCRLMDGAHGKSFGVRDEIRGSGFAIKEAIQSALQKVLHFLLPL